MGEKRDFLSLRDVSAEELIDLVKRGVALKELRSRGEPTPSLAGRTLGMIFEKASTRTRVSFEVGMFEPGRSGVFLAPESTQIGRGEPLRDSARVLGGYCHGILLRTFGHERASEFAQWAPVPVINGLTDLLHPCQVVADLMTIYELRGEVVGPRYAWIGDGNNMAHSWLNAAGMLGLELRLACPSGFEPDASLVAQAEAGGATIVVTDDPRAAAAGADVISTDVWASMGQESEAEERRRAFSGYCVDEPLLAVAADGAHVLHCLPAHRGEEISPGVLDGPQSAVWQQAENRLHVQKAILELVMG